jgi:tetratricopeptide (TPR) repeat protein
LVKRYPLRQAIWDLEKVDLDACRLFELAEDIAENRNLSSSYIYEQVLKLNPNYFTALFKLAEDYLDTKNYQQALEKYNRAYKVDPTRAYEGYELTRGKKYRIWWNKNRLTLALLSVFLLTISVTINLFQLSQVQTQLKEKKARLAELEKLDDLIAELEKLDDLNDPTSISMQPTMPKEQEEITKLKAIRRTKVIVIPWWEKTLSSGTNATISGTPGTKNMLSGAGTANRVVGTVRTGDRVQILGSSYDKNGYQWYKVYHPQSGTTGWIAADQLISSD